jgi:hypothetical protein
MVISFEYDGAPSKEKCVRVGIDDYMRYALRQCEVYIRQLRRQFGPEPPSLTLSVVQYGEFLTVLIQFDAESAMSREYTTRLATDMPAYWDETSRHELDGTFHAS